MRGAYKGSPETGVKRVSVIVGLSSTHTLFKMLQEKDEQISRLESMAVLKEAKITGLEARLTAVEDMMRQQQYAMKNNGGSGY